MKIRSTILFPIIVLSYFLLFLLVAQFNIISVPVLRTFFWNTLPYSVGLAIAISIILSSFKIQSLAKEAKYVVFCILLTFFCVFIWYQVVASNTLNFTEIVDVSNGAFWESPRPSENIEFFSSKEDSKNEDSQYPMFFWKDTDNTFHTAQFSDSILHNKMQEDLSSDRVVFLQWKDDSRTSFLSKSFLPLLLLSKGILSDSYGYNIYVQLSLFFCLIVLVYASGFFIGYLPALFSEKFARSMLWLFLAFMIISQSSKSFIWLIIGIIFSLFINFVLIATVLRTIGESKGGT